MTDRSRLSSPPPITDIDAHRAQRPARLLDEAYDTRRSALEFSNRSIRALAIIDAQKDLRDRSDH